MPKRVSTIKESKTGRNEKFRDNFSKTNMTRSQFVSQIEKGKYPKHHVRVIGGVKTPVSNPDSTRNNNLD